MNETLDRGARDQMFDRSQNLKVNLLDNYGRLHFYHKFGSYESNFLTAESEYYQHEKLN